VTTCIASMEQTKESLSWRRQRTSCSENRRRSCATCRRN